MNEILSGSYSTSNRTRRESPIAAKLLEGGSLRQLWVAGLKKELDFIREQFPLLEQGIRPEREFPGVVPYSSRRFATQRWPTLYRKHIAPLLPPILRGQRAGADCRAGSVGEASGAESRALVVVEVLSSVRACSSCSQQVELQMP